jgi:hypothetical protein
MVAVIVRCLAVGGAVYGTNIAGSWVCTTHGRTGRQLRVAMIAGPVYAAAYLLGGMYGPVGVACSFSIVCCVLRYPVFRYLLADSPIRPADLIVPLLIVVGVAAAAALAAIAAGSVATTGIFTSLAVKTGTYAAVVVAASLTGLIRVPFLGTGKDRHEL